MDGQHSRATRILVVDDHPDTCVLTGRILKAAGFEVGLADGYAAAIAAAQDCSPDILLSDLHLPDGDGCDLLAALRLIAPGLPAVVVTGSEDDDVRPRCRRAGFEAFLLKPVDPDQLLATLQIVAADQPAAGRQGSVNVVTG